ncbi:MAG: Terminase small subunit [Myxococcaceae bacterium]|nr:Terminase small subunit [Myxococcaceae bacterium]
MRVKVATDHALMRAMKSKCAARRPICPTCRQTAPAPDEPRDHWTQNYGHRDQGGAPCKGWQGRRALLITAEMIARGDEPVSRAPLRLVRSEIEREHSEREAPCQARRANLRGASGRKRPGNSNEQRRLKTERFVHEYLLDQHAVRAAERAGYRKETALETGLRLLTRPEIQTAISKGLASRTRHAFQESEPPAAVPTVEQESATPDGTDEYFAAHRERFFSAAPVEAPNSTEDVPMKTDPTPESVASLESHADRADYPTAKRAPKRSFNLTMEEQKLRRARFVREYLVDRDPTQAALRAGYGKANAGRTARKLLAAPDVQTELATAGAPRAGAEKATTKKPARSRKKLRHARRRVAVKSVSPAIVPTVLTPKLAQGPANDQRISVPESDCDEVIAVDRLGRVSFGDLNLLPASVSVVVDQSGVRVSVKRARAA